MQPLATAFGFLGVVCFVLGAFFAIRGVYKFNAWRSGENDELWTFLSMILGCGSLVVTGIPMLTVAIFPKEVESLLDIMAPVIFIGLLLGLAAIGLMTFYYFQKWRSAK